MTPLAFLKQIYLVPLINFRAIFERVGSQNYCHRHREDTITQVITLLVARGLYEHTFNDLLSDYYGMRLPAT